MKKLLLVATLLTASLVSANIGVVKSNKQDEVMDVLKRTLKKVNSDNPVFIAVETWCGKVFYLDLNDYSSNEAFEKDVIKFQNQQCALSVKPTFSNK